MRWKTGKLKFPLPSPSLDSPHAPWPEDNEKPYHTDKPDWDAFGAMLLVAACHTYDEPVPPTVEKGWDFMEHPAIARLTADEERVWSLFRQATWWLPLIDAFLFQAPLPTNDTATIGTVGGLRKELEKINQMTWQADENTILGWTETEGYPVDGTVGPNGQYSKADIPEHTQYDTQSLAKFAFSIFWQGHTVCSGTAGTCSAGLLNRLLTNNFQFFFKLNHEKVRIVQVIEWPNVRS